MYVGLSAR